jgi:serine/threonine protein kinase
VNTTSEPADNAPADDPRLLRAAQEYLAELEAGGRPRRGDFVARYPDLAGELGPYLDALDMVHGATPHLHSTAPRPAVADALPVEPLGDFRIEHEIGRGGMGVVYEAVQLSLGRRVALKVLPFAAALDAKQLQRFQNEAQAAAQLHHTNIVPVYAVGSERGVHYYAMQLIDGQNLADLIAQLRPREAGGEARSRSAGPEPAPPPATVTGAVAQLSTQRATRSRGFYRTAAHLAAQAAEALEHAHQLGVIHRDIKPANLMVDARGNLWVTDFGLAQFHNRAGLTRTGDLLGTLRYMSPEQAAGQGATLDPRTDVYSLGATLYELLTLEPLFGGADHARLLRQILYDEPRPLRAVDGAVPPELETVVLKAVSKSPSDRYATAQEFADDLHRFLDNQPIRARRPTLAQRGRKLAQRHPSVVFAGMLLCALSAAGLTVGILLLQNEEKKTRAALRDVEKQADEARVQATIARDAVNEMIEVSEQELVYRPGMEAVRKRLLESALKYYGQFIEQRRDDPQAQAELAVTKGRVEKILRALTGLQGAGLYNLLNRDDVLTDLHATAAQRAHIAEASSGLNNRLREWFEGYGRIPADERSSQLLKLAEAAEAAETGAKEVLLPEQLRRLKQIELQLKGPFAFHDADVVAGLKLTDGQKERIRTIEGTSFFRGRGGPGGGGVFGGRGGPGGRGSGPGAPRRGPEEEARAACEKIQESVLTQEQRARWKEMTGEPFRGPGFPPFGPPPGPPPG